jgi:predicted dehydrogenase/GNAT superfamily N-acetyltransferase
MTARINLGIVGACGRGAAFRVACGAHADRVAVRAVCDVNLDELESARQRLGAEVAFADYEQMLDEGGVDAVIVGTPMPFHAPQSIAALNRGIHVLSEVPAGVNIQECMDLVAACRNSDATYMMGENFTYLRSNVLVREMVRRGEFGEVYYAEGEYVHELKQLNEQTRWRRTWQTGIDGVTYPTHSLGPILQWFEGQRVISVCCAGSGHHYLDPRGDDYENQDSCIMLCKMSAGGLVKIRVDMLSDRPHNMTRYVLQGTRGAYESHRREKESHLVFLRSRHSEDVLNTDSHEFDPDDAWEELDVLEDKFLPDWYRDHQDVALKAGHGGGDYFEILDFIDAIEGKRPCPVGIHEALDMTLPGLVSQQSILQGGEWLPVPDSRTWVEPAYQVQLMMRWPAGCSAPHADVPKGYRLRLYSERDECGYLALMHAVGFASFSVQSIHDLLERALPHGFFVVEHEPDGRVVAAATATHHPWPGLPHGGEVSFVGTLPDHQGRRLGRAVSAEVVRRFLDAGYENIYLRTDDYRLPAIKLYLNLGFEPWLTDEGISERWSKVKPALQ